MYQISDSSGFLSVLALAAELCVPQELPPQKGAHRAAAAAVWGSAAI